MNQQYSLNPSKFLQTHEQKHLEALLELFRHSEPRNTLMLAFLLKTGLRPQEMLNLRWMDVDLESSLVFVRTLKNGNNRHVPLVSDLIDRFKALGPGNPEDRIFDIKYNQLRNIWDQYKPSNKKLYSLRHTFAINAFEVSNTRVVQYSLGHKSFATTSIYLDAHVSLEQLKKAILTMDQSLIAK